MPSQERVNWAKFRVAAVCVLAMAILSVLFYLLTGGTLLEQKVLVYLFVPDAAGVTPGVAVRVDGIGVGKVKEVALSGLSAPLRVVRVTMEIEKDRLPSIPSDSYAQIGAETAIGDKFVDITSGKSTEPIRADSELIYKPETDLMKTLDIAQFQTQLKVVDQLVTDLEEGKGRVGQLVVGEQMYSDMVRKVAELHKGLVAAVESTTSAGQLIYTDALYRKLRQPVQDIDQALARIQSGQGSGQMLRDSGQYDSLRNQVVQLRKTVADIRTSPFLTSDQLYTDWNRTVAAMIRSVDDLAISPALATSATYDNLSGFAKELQHTMKDFRENPKKFLRLKVF